MSYDRFGYKYTAVFRADRGSYCEVKLGF